MKLKTAIIVILSVLFLIIVFQNTQVVSFRLLFWQLTMSRIVWLIIVLIIGLVMGYFLGAMRKSNH